MVSKTWFTLRPRSNGKLIGCRVRFDLTSYFTHFIHIPLPSSLPGVWNAPSFPVSLFLFCVLANAQIMRTRVESDISQASYHWRSRDEIEHLMNELCFKMRVSLRETLALVPDWRLKVVSESHRRGRCEVFTFVGTFLSSKCNEKLSKHMFHTHFKTFSKCTRGKCDWLCLIFFWRKVHLSEDFWKNLSV